MRKNGNRLLKKSRIHSLNRTLSYYRINIKRAKWAKLRRKRIVFKALTNKDRISPLSYVNKRSVRLRTRPSTARFNRIYWKCLYPGVNVTKIRLDRHYKLRKVVSTDESILWSIESRFDVLLWRAGIVATVSMAKQLLRSGKVSYYDNGVWYTASRSDRLLTNKIVLKVSNWDSIKDLVTSKWKNRMYKHKVPSYMIVDYVNGMIGMKHKPKDGEVLVPSYMRLRLSSLDRS